MTTAYLIVLGLCAALVLYTYLGYPALLKALSTLKPAWAAPPPPTEWPSISITVPAFNEEETIRGTIDSLLALDYPAERRQILVVSDASTDRTDEIVGEYADRGVELFRVTDRRGKTAAENAARQSLTGDIVVNTDASVRIHRDAIKALVRCFGDPEVGVASGRDVSTAAESDSANIGEKGYVGYEMWVRALETRMLGIVQASGCLYATKREIHDCEFPEHLTRDYGAVALSREAGLKAVSVDGALCNVPRQRSLRREYSRKTRTMTRGLKTVAYRRGLLNPFRYGLYSWMVFSHKICRWLVPVALVVGTAAVVGLATADARAIPFAALGVLVALFAVAGWLWPNEETTPKIFSVPAYLVIANLAALNAWANLFRGVQSAAWSPTRRESVKAGRAG
ncbi:MAG: glycosyltransferase [Gemmatimonadota bacterium]|nr:glycosyltransferase [Gemmatimonadota bacterium]